MFGKISHDVNSNINFVQWLHIMSFYNVNCLLLCFWKRSWNVDPYIMDLPNSNT